MKSVLELIEKADARHRSPHRRRLLGKYSRVLPEGMQAVIDEDQLAVAGGVHLAQQAGNVSRQMYRTFNCGVGMVIALPEAEVEAAIALLTAAGEKAWKIGKQPPLPTNNKWSSTDEKDRGGGLRPGEQSPGAD